MTKTELVKTDTGSVTVYEETPAERDERIRAQAEEADRKVHLTPGQLATLAKATRRRR